jgi:hypothetical protein
MIATRGLLTGCCPARRERWFEGRGERTPSLPSLSRRRIGLRRKAKCCTAMSRWSLCHLPGGGGRQSSSPWRPPRAANSPIAPRSGARGRASAHRPAHPRRRYAQPDDCPCPQSSCRDRSAHANRRRGFERSLKLAASMAEFWTRPVFVVVVPCQFATASAARKGRACPSEWADISSS